MSNIIKWFMENGLFWLYNKWSFNKIGKNIHFVCFVSHKDKNTINLKLHIENCSNFRYMKHIIISVVGVKNSRCWGLLKWEKNIFSGDGKKFQNSNGSFLMLAPHEVYREEITYEKNDYDYTKVQFYFINWCGKKILQKYILIKDVLDVRIIYEQNKKLDLGSSYSGDIGHSHKVLFHIGKLYFLRKVLAHPVQPDDKPGVINCNIVTYNEYCMIWFNKKTMKYNILYKYEK